MIIIPKLKLGRQTDSQLNAYAEEKYDKLNGNAAFAGVSPSAADVEARRVDFSAKMAKANDGTKADTEAKNQVRRALEEMLTLQALDCARIAAGDLAVFLTSGYEAKDVKGAPVGELGTTDEIVFRNYGKNAGELQPDWAPANAANFQHVTVTTTIPSELNVADISFLTGASGPETNEITSIANEEEVINSIEDLPIAPLLKNILLEAQKGRSAKQALQTEINRYLANSRFALNNCLQYFMNDTVCETVHDSIMELLREQPSFLYIRTMIENHLFARQFDSAWVKLNLLNGMPEYENYVLLISYLVNIGIAGHNVSYLREDETGKELMESIAADSSKYGYASARAMLSHVFGYQYPVELPEGGSAGSPRIVKPVKIKNNPSCSAAITAQPNPFAGQSQIRILIDDLVASAVFKISNMSGKEIIQFELKQGINNFVLHSLGLKPGVYAGQLFRDGQLTESIKLVHVR